MHDLGGDRSDSGALRRGSASCDGYGRYLQCWPASRLLRRSHVTMYVPSARSNRRTISGSSTSRRPSRITFAGSAMDRERTAHPPFQRKSRQVVSRAASGTKAQLVFPVLNRSHDDSTFVSVKLNAGIGLAAQTDAGLPSPGKTRASEPRAQQPRGSGNAGVKTSENGRAKQSGTAVPLLRLVQLWRCVHQTSTEQWCFPASGASHRDLRESVGS
jgi:hypothetical protein